MSKHRARAYSFTINNDTYDDLVRLINASFVYCCFGFEVGDSGTPHIQGYIYLHDAMTKSALSKKILPRAALFASKGTLEHNRVYTSKSGEFYEFGTPPTQGRAAWEKIVEVMDDPTSNPHLYNQYGRMYRQLTYCKEKDHERRLIAIRLEDKYTFARLHSTVSFLTEGIEIYDNEDVVIVPCYGSTQQWVSDWVNGYPPKIKRGYEILTVDPRIVYLTYGNTEEINYILKNIGDKLDAWIKEAPETVPFTEDDERVED